MAGDVFDRYLSEINEAYLRGNATEHTHRPALKVLIEALGDKITATNERSAWRDCCAVVGKAEKLKGWLSSALDLLYWTYVVRCTVVRVVIIG